MADLVIKGLILAVALLGLGISIIDESDAVLYFEPREIASTTPVSLEVSIDARKPVNVISGTISYPPELLSVSVQETDDSPIDLWLTSPKNDTVKGEISFSGGKSAGGITGEHALFSITVSTTSDEHAELSFINPEVYAHDGQGKPVKVRSELYAFNTPPPPPEDTGASGTSPISEDEAKLLISRSDFDASGSVGLVDLSIMLMQLASGYSKTHDVNADNTLDLTDLSLLLSVIGK